MKGILRSIGLVALLGCQTNGSPSAAESGVGIVTSGCAGPTTEVGSGITLGRKGQVITAAHAVAGATSITVIDSDDHEFPATITAFDKDVDLALLDVPGLDTSPLDVGETRLGDAVAVVWSPEDGVHTLPVRITKRLKITIEDIYVEDVARRAGIELEGDVSVGDSGGAVVDENGDVVGIIYARSRERPQVAFATDHTETERLLGDRPTDPTDRCQ